MNKYTYQGPVMQYDKCVADKWEASTYAATKQKARSNMAYQFKKKNNLVPNVKITLPGEVVMVQ